MNVDTMRTWWESHDGEGEDDEYAHHPSDVFETAWGLGVVLYLPEDDDDSYQDGDSVSPDYMIAVRHSLTVLFEQHPDLMGTVRVALDFDSGTDGEALVQTAAFWDSDALIQEAG